MNKLPDTDTVISALMSVSAHALVLALAAFITLGGGAPPAPPEMPREPVHVKIASDKPLKRLPVSRAGSVGPVVGVPGYGGPPSDVLATGTDDTKPRGIAREEDFTELLVRGKVEERRDLPDKPSADRTREATAAKRLVRDDIVSADPDAMPIPPQGEPGSLPEEEDIPKEFVKEMPGFTPVASDSKSDTVSYKPLRGAGGTGAMGGGQGGGSGIDEYLLADLVVYTDPADGTKYFKITLMAGKEADRFKVMPKDLTFLIDSSLSIQSEIEGFKKGMYYCLDRLGKDDTFNIVKFDSASKALGSAPLAVTPEALASGKAFIDRLLPSNITNLYGVLSRAVGTPPGRRPSYIVVLSDGRPTAGLRDSREIIRKITADNKAAGRPIFFFCGAGRVNRYLVDFLSFCNRGWAEYAGQPAPMSSELSGFYDKIKDPIILAPRYRFSGVPADEVYPKTLSDFFRGVSFVLYGRFTGELDEFSMQLTGEGADERVEFIFADSFKRAREGSPDIARQWAYNKIYHLIALLVEKGNEPAIAGQIQELYDRYGITTPYAEGTR